MIDLIREDRLLMATFVFIAIDRHVGSRVSENSHTAMTSAIFIADRVFARIDHFRG